MTQSIASFTPRDGINAAAHRKESRFLRELCAVDLDAGRPVVTLRIYGTQARNYACVWISHRSGSRHANGSGMAGGYGYHRASAAAQSALAAAGVKLVDDIDGVGDGAMRDAVEALARHMGIARVYVHEAHA